MFVGHATEPEPALAGADTLIREHLTASRAMPEITRQMLRDYLHDALPDAELATVEKALRESAGLRAVYQEVIEQEDRGEHTVGAIWRRERVSCLSRDQLGSYVLGSGDPEPLDYTE